ncbi:hypothetical protein GCM10008018_41910 [Paenibacillus marchantiophytorum]|uniref:Fumarylacetoacetase-like C-terminal domain-containing protein n=1 Tax=Paenibacillus marchantiophytorum TaxID=1619310 RepID=A0ABQ1EX04_9BACL|nr:fumarylacetoacetate hydrolase family protein [Paenibacillus marchantiophytorum]GFZ91229.1 hypothetical protein GCM10008018_41910 [Paenibacillus marchantiophytorum]
MKLLTFRSQNELKLGVHTDSGVLDIEQALQQLSPDFSVPLTVHEAILGGTTANEALQKLVHLALKSEASASLLRSEDSLDYGPCVTNPSKIICVGLNYRKHAEETNAPIPQTPILFNKFSNTLTGHGHDIALPRVTKEVDYEAELVIVIGKQAKYVAKEQAYEHVYGYCCVNDLSARDLQMRTSQWLLGKSCDGFSPLGPYLVTADEVGNPNDLTISTTVNGKVRQNSHTSDMIFHCDEIVSYISQHMTLNPGDIILTGTPEGVVLGDPVDQRVYLQDGDVVTISIEKLGSLTNRLINE